MALLLYGHRNCYRHCDCYGYRDCYGHWDCYGHRDCYRHFYRVHHHFDYFDHRCHFCHFHRGHRHCLHCLRLLRTQMKPSQQKSTKLEYYLSAYPFYRYRRLSGAWFELIPFQHLWLFLPRDVRSSWSNNKKNIIIHKGYIFKKITTLHTLLDLHFFRKL